MTNIEDSKTNDKYSVGMDVYYFEKIEQGCQNIHGVVVEMGEETIVVQWDDLKEETEYRRDEIELDGEQLSEIKNM